MHLTKDILYYFQNNEVKCDIKTVVEELQKLIDSSECDRYKEIVYTTIEDVVDIIIDNCYCQEEY